jgi:hypothetical protein
MTTLRVLLRPVTVLVLLLCLAAVGRPARADDSAAAYDAAVIEAKAHAADPGPWTVSNLKVVAGPGSGDGNAYVDGKVVAATFTKSSYYAGAYPGLSMTVYGQPTSSATWVTVGGELKSYLTSQGVTFADVKLETSRVLGMSQKNSNDAVAELLVSPDVNAIQRPTKDPSAAGQPTSLGSSAAFVRPAGMTDAAYGNFVAYYNSWEAAAYGSSNFPWTQLGYTYRWGLGSTLADIRGLSEFIVLGGTRCTVYAVYSLGSYLYTAGNGSGDFRVTGDLDTLWAGRQFQPRGDSVVIEAGATVSGGQGLLVSSPGYTVANAGTIAGTTSDKYGLGGTADVAVLFLGREAAPGSLAEPYGRTNTLLNAGSIESPGTAVMALAGDTVVVNSGTISGGAAAVVTGDGADRLEVRGGVVSGRVDLGGGQDSLVATGPSALAFALAPQGTSAAPVQNVESVNLGSGTTLSLTFDPSGYVANGQRYAIVSGGSVALADSGLAVTSNLPMARFTAAADASGLAVTGWRDPGWYTRSLANPSLGAALDAAAATVRPAMEGLVGFLDHSPDAAGAGSRLLPGPQTRSMALAVDGASAFAAAFADRLAGLRGRDGAAGLAAPGFYGHGAGLGDLDALGRLAVAGQPAALAEPWRAAVPGAAPAAPFGDGPGLGEATSEGPLEAFAALYGGQGQGVSSGDAPGYASTSTGAMGGLGIRALPGLRLGLVGGYAWTGADYFAGRGRSDDQVWRAGAYAAADAGPWSLDALAAYGWHTVRTSRPVWDSLAESTGTMGEWLGFARAARRFALGAGVAAEPFAAGQLMSLRRDAAQESGAGAANLLTAAGTSLSLASVAGLRLEKTFEFGAWRLTPEVFGGWKHEYGDTAPSVTAALAGAPDAPFAASGGAVDRDQARFGAGVRLWGAGGAAVAARFDGTAGGTRSAYGLSLGLRFGF